MQAAAEKNFRALDKRRILAVSSAPERSGAGGKLFQNGKNA